METKLKGFQSPDQNGFVGRMLFELGYRRAMRVTEVMLFRSGNSMTGYFVCPRCDLTMERECMAFCDRCGQRLDWTDYENARIVYPGRRR